MLKVAGTKLLCIVIELDIPNSLVSFSFHFDLAMYFIPSQNSFLKELTTCSHVLHTWFVGSFLWPSVREKNNDEGIIV